MCDKQRSFLLFVLLFVCGMNLFSQNRYTVTGTLLDSLNHDKIFYATVGLMTQDSTARVVGSAFSSADGTFTLTDIPSGSYEFRVSLVGYEMLSMPVRLEGSSKTLNLGEVMMHKQSGFLQEVSIKGEKPVYMMDGEKMLYNVSEDPTLEGGTASDALQNAPGVEVDVEGNITLRGVSSVEIWLNNKPSNMNEEALKQFIQQMPAGTIEKIEVITNPSARYSAKGSGGIINIVTTSKIKKNSFISFGARGSSIPSVSPFLSYVYANEKLSISLYGNYNFNVNKNSSEGFSVFRNDDNDTTTTLRTRSNSRGRSHGGGLYFNGSYTPDTSNTFSFWAGAYPSQSRTLSNSACDWQEYITNPGNYSYSDSSLSRQFHGGAYAGLWYEHSFKKEGHRISADVSYYLWGSRSNSEYDRAYQEMLDLDKRKRSRTRYSSQGISASLDYTIPYIKNGEIELGVSGGYDYTINYDSIRNATLASDFLYVVDDIRSSHHDEHAGSVDGYVTLSHHFGNFTIKGGLRTEYEWMRLRYIGLPKYDLNTGYIGLFPSLHLSYRTKSMHNFKLSYTRRVNNPDANDLSPYIDYYEDSYSTGNPDLRPAYTNSVEAGWTKFFQKFGNIGLNAFFRNSKDEFTSMSDVAYDPFFGRVVSFSQPINAGKTINTGAEFNMMYRLKSFMNIRFYANLNYRKYTFDFRDGNQYTKDNLGYSFRLNFWAKLWKVLEVNASANYRSKSISLFTTTLPSYSIDCGLRTELWKKRITLHLDVSDIFNWNRRSTSSDNPYLTSSSTSRNSWMGRSIRGGITFKFGKMELESRSNQGSAAGNMMQGE